MRNFFIYLILFVLAIRITMFVSASEGFVLAFIGAGGAGNFITSIGSIIFIILDLAFALFIAFICKKLFNANLLGSFIAIILGVIVYFISLNFYVNREIAKSNEGIIKGQAFIDDVAVKLPTSIKINSVKYQAEEYHPGSLHFGILVDADFTIKFDSPSLKNGLRFYLNDTKNNIIPGCELDADWTTVANENPNFGYNPGNHTITSGWRFFGTGTACTIQTIKNLEGQKIYVRGANNELIKILTISNIQIK